MHISLFTSAARRLSSRSILIQNIPTAWAQNLDLSRSQHPPNGPKSEGFEQSDTQSGWPVCLETQECVEEEKEGKYQTLLTKDISVLVTQDFWPSEFLSFITSQTKIHYKLVFGTSALFLTD